jgi:hypothetical protein
MATCYFIYACAALAILILVVAVNSQGSNGSIPASFIFAIALTSPAPMLLVGAAFLRGIRWAPALAVALALFHAVTLAMQVHLSRDSFVGELPWPRAQLFQVFAAQTYYLPGSLLLAVVSCAHEVWRRRSFVSGPAAPADSGTDVCDNPER